MALDRFEVRISIQKVLLGLVLVIVPLSIVGLYLTTQSDSALDASIGNHLKSVAQMYSSDISHLIQDRVAAVKLIAADPSVVDAVAASNRTYEKGGEAAIEAKLDQAGKVWSTPEGAPQVKALLTSKPSETLRHYREMDTQILSMMVTDERGIPVAATVKPGRFRLTTWDPWQAAYAGGKGAVSIGNILYDEPAKAYFSEIAVPVTESGTGQLAGIAVAAVNLSPVIASFQQSLVGADVKAFLVDESGTVVSGPRTDIFARVHSAEYDAVRDAMTNVESRQAGYAMPDLRQGRQIVGFADTGLQKTYKNLAWTVLVSQDAREATAPIRALSQFAILMVILALFMVTLLSVYYALHRNQQFSDIENVIRPQGEFSPPRTA